jgi:hypothetical protein
MEEERGEEGERSIEFPPSHVFFGGYEFKYGIPVRGKLGVEVLKTWGPAP